jgi:hypothetical protein
MSVEETTTQRKSVYGDFDAEARIADCLIETLVRQPQWYHLRPLHRQALRMIAMKMARIVNGDPEYPDNWHDIAGYATITEQRLRR